MPDDPPPHGVSLARHAEISALLAEGDRAPREVLEASELTESQWSDATLHWMTRIADDVSKRGIEAELPIAYSDAFGRAQDAITPLPQLEPEDWAALTVEIQSAGNPARPLAARRLSNADYLRLARHWAKVLSSDAAQNKRFFEVYEALQPKA